MRGSNAAGVAGWVSVRLPESTDYVEYIVVGDKVSRGALGSAHHPCLMVPDLQKALETLRERLGGRSLPAPRIGGNNRWILDIFDPDGTRTELMEPFTVR